MKAKITKDQKLVSFLNGLVKYALNHTQKDTQQWVDSWMQHHKHVFEACDKIDNRVRNSYMRGELGDCIWGCRP